MFHLKMRDRLLIIETLNRYAWCNDSRDLPLLGGTFAYSDTFAIELAETDAWGPYTGHSQLVEWRAGVMRQQTDQRRLCVSSFLHQ